MSERGRKSTKWAGTNSRFVDFGSHQLDTVISGHLTQEQITAYQQYFRVEEISHYLRKAGKGGTSLFDCFPSKEVQNFHRDPSPPPQYDQSGNRTNSRESRTIENLEKERDNLVEIAVTTIKNYDPPSDYKKAGKTTEKLYIPVQDYPDINFVGLLLGPRGNTLRQLQEESGAKLAIRGKGSVKDGKAMETAGSQSTEDRLHVLISADTTAMVNKAIKLTNEVIEKAISSPFGQNDFKRDQLRELAVLNGTLRESKPFVPPEIFSQQRKNQLRDVTQIVCHICGNIGHYSRDCMLKNERSGKEGGQHFAEEDGQQWKRQKPNNTNLLWGPLSNTRDMFEKNGAFDGAQPPAHLPQIPQWSHESRPHTTIPNQAFFKNSQESYTGYRSPPPNTRPPPTDHYLPSLATNSREAPPPPPIVKPALPRPPPPPGHDVPSATPKPPPPPPSSGIRAPPPPPK